MPSPVAPIAQAIAEGFKFLKSRQDTAQIRKMNKAIEAAEKYIQVVEKEGDFDYEMKAGRREAKAKIYKKRFFKYN